MGCLVLNSFCFGFGIKVLYALTGEMDFIESIGALQEQQEKGEEVTMGYALSKYKEMGREQGIKEGIREGIKEEKIRCAKAFVEETAMQKQPREYVLGILQTCFQLKEEEALSLYQEGML